MPADQPALEPPFPHSRFIDLNGVTVHYRHWQPQQSAGAKLLLVHGLGSSTYSYDTVGPALARAGHATVAVDLPAFGYSSRGLQFDHALDNRVALLWSLLDRLDGENPDLRPTEPWVLVGHSMGGQVVAAMALARPERTTALVQIDSAALSEGSRSRGLWFPPIRWITKAWLRNALFTPDGLSDFLEDAYGRPPTDAEIAGYRGPLQQPNTDDGLVHFARTAQSHPLPVETIQAPTLVIWGEHDEWILLEEGRELAQRLPEGALVVIPGAGHVPQETHPEMVIRLISQFLDQLAR